LGQVGASIIVRHGRYSNTTGPNPCDYDADEIIGCAALRLRIGAQRLRSECMDCSASSLASEINAKSAARSQHNGGVNVLLCDASVRFIVNGINSQVWHALHTRNQKDLANLEAE
jgi:prepilin-type processing-associated H-X9-DG protein